ncbi:Dyp-type peroxidase [Meredithblackwellia eburnea MCA 4105]
MSQTLSQSNAPGGLPGQIPQADQLHFQPPGITPSQPAPPSPATQLSPLCLRKEVSAQVQGDVILGLQKRVECFILFNIANAKAFQHLLKSTVASKISTTGQVQQAQAQIDEVRKNGGRIWLPISHVNIAFSAAGLSTLGVNLATDFASHTAFLGGQQADVLANLNDPVINGKLSTWKDVYLGKKIHGVLVVTAHTQDSLDKKVIELQSDFASSIHVLARVCGRVRPGAEEGHEHFVPTVIGFNDQGRTPGSDAVSPSVILTGQDTTPPSWIKDGSFLVFRELQQLVPEFDDFVQTTANTFQPIVPGITADAVGARIVGRWKSGAPLVLSPTHDDPVLGNDPQRRMNFDYSSDLGQVACPYAAHIRKTNPRKGTAPANIPVDPHLIIRQGIPYGDEVSASEKIAKKTTHERGLLFACYQSSLENGFQFVQKLWANNTGFPFNNTAAITTPGEDLIIGQPVPGSGRVIQGIRPNDAADPANTISIAQLFVVPRGGEYFFVPSIDALKNKLGL